MSASIGKSAGITKSLSTANDPAAPRPPIGRLPVVPLGTRRVRARPHPLSWRRTLVLALIAGAMLLPVFALAWIAVFGRGEGLATLAGIRPGVATLNTVVLLALVAIASAIVGTGAAWVVTHHSFPGRRWIAWALVLPLAVPTYLAAYAHGEFWSFTGPVQEGVRALGGFQTPRDYWFPDIRSLPGAALVMASVLYPYVYLSTRAMLALAGPRMGEACRMLGASRGRAARAVILPMARPAIAIGTVLAAMETLNDIGAVEYLGVRTLTRSIYALWLNRGDPSAAAELSLILLGFVAILVVIERIARGAASYYERPGRPAGGPERLRGWRGWGASALCMLPILVGFGVPALVFAEFAWPRGYLVFEPALWDAVRTSLLIGTLAALVTVLLSLGLLFAVRGAGRTGRSLARLATLGYAMPGTVVALGLFLPLAVLDNAVDGFARGAFGMATGLVLTGSLATVVYAHAVRFTAIAEGTLAAGAERLSPNIEAAARTLGRTEWGAVREVTLPLLAPAIATAGLLVFIDSVKELSATILVRPFGVQTLSTYAYELASQGRPEAVGFAALAIVALGMLPVLIVSRTALGVGRAG